MAINNTGSRRLLVTLTALFAALCGLYLLIGGGWLVAIGGSWYYPIAGLVMLGVAWMLWRSKRAALWLYAALLLGTMIWGRLGSWFRLLGADSAQRHSGLLRHLADPAVCLASPGHSCQRRSCRTGGGAVD
ncbi:glucose dehydrogenase [Escherichia coli]|uniref:Glucose dehydrogenase n=1 Tax=Escherichia coli TaxID=562 RepID=A0A377KCZ9_ECOLX|nr:glucose dehydrogenase [Escherichia coli]